jgi:hypothetical protein
MAKVTRTRLQQNMRLLRALHGAPLAPRGTPNPSLYLHAHSQNKTLSRRAMPIAKHAKIAFLCFFVFGEMMKWAKGLFIARRAPLRLLCVCVCVRPLPLSLSFCPRIDFLCVFPKN